MPVEERVVVSKQQTLALQVLALRRGPLQTSAAIPLYSTLLISRAIGLKLCLAKVKENEYCSLKMQGLRPLYYPPTQLVQLRI